MSVDTDRLRDVLAVVRFHGFELAQDVADYRPARAAYNQAERAIVGASRGTIVDLIENFYAETIGAVVSRIDALSQGTTGLLRAYLRADDFMQIHRATWLSMRPTPIAKEWSELRPFVAKGKPQSYQQGASDLDPVLTGQDLLGTSVPDADTKEVKALLLYAHSVVIADPFGPRDQLDLDPFEIQGLGWSPQMAFGGYGQAIRRISRFEDRVSDFVDALKLVANLRELIRSGVVAVLPAAAPSDLYLGDPDDLLERICDRLFGSGPFRFRKTPRSADQIALATIVRERAEAQMRGLFRFGVLVNSFASDQLDEIGLECIIDEMIDKGAIDARLVIRTDEDRRLTRLATLTLPGVDSLSSRDIHKVRKHDHFSQFREDIRASLEEMGRDIDEIAFKQSMAEAEMRLRTTTKRTVSAGDLVKGMVGWTVGAMASWSIDDWRSLAGATAGVAGYEFAQSRTPGRKALFNHYVAVR